MTSSGIVNWVVEYIVSDVKVARYIVICFIVTCFLVAFYVYNAYIGVGDQPILPPDRQVPTSQL